MLFFEEDLFIVDLEGPFEQLVDLIAREEGGEEEFPVDGGDGDGVVDEDGAASLLHLQDVLPWDLDEGLPEEQVLGVEVGVEVDVVAGDEDQTREDQSVSQGAGAALDVLFIGQEGDALGDELCVFGGGFANEELPGVGGGELGGLEGFGLGLLVRHYVGRVDLVLVTQLLELLGFFDAFESLDFVELPVEGDFGGVFEFGERVLFEELELLFD